MRLTISQVPDRPPEPADEAKTKIPITITERCSATWVDQMNFCTRSG